MSIQTQLSVPMTKRDTDWLMTSLQYAIELEHATIPPYLCGMWSVKDQQDPVAQLISSVVMEEMLHMGLACNMLTTIGGTPEINSPGFVPTYPGPLPHGVRPSLQEVALVGLSPDVVKNTFMQIEYPEGGPIAAFALETYQTIGAFYEAILAAFQTLDPSAITGKRQLTDEGLGLFAINSFADAQKAVTTIRQQGEGTSQSPYESGFSGEYAHYYRFAEIAHGQRLIKNDEGLWVYQGDALPFPDCWPMAKVPAEGYPQSQAFDKTYTSLLAKLHEAWLQGSADALSDAVGIMFNLAGPATNLLKTPIPNGQGNYGPSFKYTP